MILEDGELRVVCRTCGNEFIPFKEGSVRGCFNCEYERDVEIVDDYPSYPSRIWREVGRKSNGH